MLRRVHVPWLLLAAAAAAAVAQAASPPPTVDPGVLKARPELATEKRAVVMVDRRERVVDAREASEAGLTLVDLTDTWTPFIFATLSDDKGNPLPNRYRPTFLGLANDTTDRDGQPLEPGDHNYLELYGIPPTLGVLRARFLTSATNPCAAVDLAKIRAVTSIPTREPKQEQLVQLRDAKILRRVEAARTAAKVDTLEALVAAQPKLKDDVEILQKAAAARSAFAEVEKRLACEGMFPAPPAPPKGKGKKVRTSSYERHTAGRLDEAMRIAIVRFQHKHKIYDSTALRKDTMTALGRPLLDNDHLALLRVLAERVVSAANVLEDGSVGEVTYTGAGGEKLPVRNLVDEAVKKFVAELGLETPEAALAFFQRHPAEDLRWLRFGVQMPAPPEYHSAAMDLSVEIDRGDVDYDPPFDEKGKPNKTVRHQFPMLRLYVNYLGKQIPLVKWRTTIGGWRSDLASNGYEYFRYKGSDVGPRVWRHIVAGPVWIAPTSSPVRGLVKGKLVNGSYQTVVNYDELGPGYLSAYGLVAAYNVEPGRAKDGSQDGDNGIRVHGSSEYRSIRNPEGFSHGCHRLVNHLAVRLFSFVLQHRTVVLVGEKPLGFHRQFLWKDHVYEVRMPTRGFHYLLDPPVPVTVLLGNILSDRKKPISAYMPKPGVEYPAGPPPSPGGGDKAGGGDQ